MAPYLLSPAAQADLEAIWDYTVETWGLSQAETYILSIRSTLDGLVRGNIKSRSAEDIRAGYRKVRCGSHIIFFQTTIDTIHVIRILHGRMDVSSLDD
jgi:toxin ParE1/3/4